jgi:hypothetical protein
MIGWREEAMSQIVDQSWRRRSHRSLPPSPSWLWRTRRDGSCLPFTRHFMPGYHRFVPPGQTHLRPYVDAHARTRDYDRKPSG